MPPHMYLAGVEMGKGAKFTTNEISGRSVNCLQNYSSVLKSKLYTILKINFFLSVEEFFFGIALWRQTQLANKRYYC